VRGTIGAKSELSWNAMRSHAWPARTRSGEEGEVSVEM
jgi:hypothetical protein